MEEEGGMLKGETCPSCGQKTLTLFEKKQEVPYFGNVFMFSMDCENDGCDYHLSDLEVENNKGPAKIEFEVSSEDDMKVRVVKSGSATVKLPRIMTLEPGPASNGYVTNIEGILNRVKRMLEQVRDEADDKSDRKKAKNQLKKIQDVMWGNDTMKITIEDPNGNSAIISEKSKVSKLSVKK